MLIKFSFITAITIAALAGVISWLIISKLLKNSYVDTYWKWEAFTIVFLISCSGVICFTSLLILIF